MLYLVSYDLTIPGRDYTKLSTRLSQLGAERVLESQWFVVSNATAMDLTQDLMQFVDGSDRILTTELTQKAAWRTLLLSDDRAKQWFQHARP
jgi:CRISPR-associated endonuclease Cas2